MKTSHEICVVDKARENNYDPDISTLVQLLEVGFVKDLRVVGW